MFNWVCPQCGKDVPPSKTECPYCAERAREAAAAGPPQHAQPPGPPPAQPGWPAPPPQGWQQPQAPAPPPPHQYYQAPPQPPPAQAPPPQAGHNPPWPGQPPQYAPQHPPAAWLPQQPRSSPPAWLMGIAFALAFIGIFAAVYFGIQHFGKTNPAEKAGLESPAAAAQQKVSNPLQKSVEVVGIRMVTEGKKPVAKFVVVNHSNAEISDLAANVTLWASTSRSEEDSVGSFSFKLRNLAANGSAELTSPLKTKLKLYELPDWQNATAEVQITTP